MRTVTFHGPAHFFRLDGRVIRRRVPEDVPNDWATKAEAVLGDRLTIEDQPEPQQDNEGEEE